jgi:hypothetical protein
MPLPQAEENKIQKLLDLLEEHNLILKRMMLTCAELETVLRGRLNEQPLE